MTSEELRKVIKCGETSLVQFKQEFTTQKEIATEMIAFANSRGGTILFDAPRYISRRKLLK
jgi:predicted HTH transcriptional regulator